MSKVWESTFSAIYDPLLWVGERAGMAQRRSAMLSQATGRVLELGAGTGLNLPHYPDNLEELVLTEPSADGRPARAPRDEGGDPFLGDSRGC